MHKNKKNGPWSTLYVLTQSTSFVLAKSQNSLNFQTSFIFWDCRVVEGRGEGKKPSWCSRFGESEKSRRWPRKGVVEGIPEILSTWSGFRLFVYDCFCHERKQAPSNERLEQLGYFALGNRSINGLISCETQTLSRSTACRTFLSKDIVFEDDPLWGSWKVENIFIK